MGKGGDDPNCSQSVGMGALLEAEPTAPVDLKDYFRPEDVEPMARRCLLWHAKGLEPWAIADKLGIDSMEVMHLLRDIQRKANEEYCTIMANLPEKRQKWLDRAVREYYLEGRSLRDIARGLGLNKETIRRGLIKAKVQRRAPAKAAPEVRVFDPNSPENKKLLKDARAAQRAQAKAGNMVGAMSFDDQIDMLSSHREVHSYVQEGPFADTQLLEMIGAKIVQKQNALKGPVARFDWEHLTAEIYNEYYDEAYVMEDDSNPGRDVEVRIGGRVFGISNKSETHSKLSDDNDDFRISHFMYYGDDGDFGGKVKEHIEDYDFILNLRAYEGISPTTGERAMCYRVYKMDSTALHRLTEQKYPFEGRYSTETFYAPSPPYPPYQEIKVQKKGNSVAIPSIPIGLAELQAAFWVPMPPSRGRQKKDGN